MVRKLPLLASSRSVTLDEPGLCAEPSTFARFAAGVANYDYHWSKSHLRINRIEISSDTTLGTQKLPRDRPALYGPAPLPFSFEETTYPASWLQ